jgi:signal transduction histidine kinase
MKAVPGEKIASIADVVDEGLALCREGRIWWASDRMAVLLGCASPDSLMGESMMDRLRDSGQGLPCLNGPGVRCALGSSEGSSGSLQVHRIPVRAGELWLVGALDEDASEGALERFTHRALEQSNREVTRLREELKRQQAEHEDLLAALGHELKTPLTVIGGYSRLLLSPEVGPLNTAQKHYLSESRKSCKRLDEFVESLLEVSPMAMVEGDLALEPRCLETAISQSYRALVPLFKEKSLTCQMKVDPSAQRAVFDGIRVGQVLNNLLGNAIRFSKVGGRIEVGTRLGDRRKDEFVEVFVADNGAGIESGERDRIFEPYARAGDQSADSGLGLGLAICKSIVDAHGGSIRVEDEPGGGSRFAFTLPRVVSGIDEEEEEMENG